MSAEEITTLYFQQLDQKDVKDLYNVYKYDFLLFGYSFTHGGERFPNDENVARCLETDNGPSEDIDHWIGRNIDLITRESPPKSNNDYIWPELH